MIELTPRLRELRARFDGAATAAGATRSIDAVFEDLVVRYGEPHRHYHTLAHIEACLVWLDWFSGSADRAEEVEFALWFHDAVYTLGRDDNERRSAELAREQLGALGVGGAAIDRIAKHIETTEKHIAAGGDAALVVSLDLSILGARRRDFDLFERQIRLEYAHVSEPVYRAARRGVLQTFLSRPEIYEVSSIRAEFEATARAIVRGFETAGTIDARGGELRVLMRPPGGVPRAELRIVAFVQRADDREIVGSVSRPVAR